MTDRRLMLYNHQSAIKHLKCVNFIDSVPNHNASELIRANLWNNRTATLPIETTMGTSTSEALAPGKNLQWTTWMSLNKFCTGYGIAADLMHNWGYSENRVCECGDTQTMTHLLSCSLLPTLYSTRFLEYRCSVL